MATEALERADEEDEWREVEEVVRKEEEGKKVGGPADCVGTAE